MHKTDRKIMAYSILAGAIFWLGDALGDWSFKFNQQPFLNILLYDAPSHEFFIRPLVVLLFLGSGILSCILLRKIKKSEGSYQDLFENVNDAIFLQHSKKDGNLAKFVEVNGVACRMLGYTRQELLQLSADELADPAQAQALQKNLAAGGQVMFEATLVSKDGSKIPVEINAHNYLLDGQRMSLAVVRDISARKQTERAVRDSERQMRILTGRLLKAQEKERERISKELHDELGQSLLFQKIQLSFIRDRLSPKQASLKAECNDLLNHMEVTIENMRRLAKDLKPWGLDELGFPLAAKLLVEESCKLYGISSHHVRMEDIGTLFSPEEQLNIYRILQESLTNIGKHAQATEVSAEISRFNGRVIIKIEDNGKGFDSTKFTGQAGEKRGIGLSTIKERALILGGELAIRSREDSGTSITLSIPKKALAA